MSSVSRIAGFRPVKTTTGTPYMGNGNVYFCPASDATQIAVGDPVQLLGDARSPTGSPTVTKLASATSVPLGICVGMLYTGMGDVTNVPPVTDLNVPTSNLRAASTNRYILVIDDPGVIYEVQYAGTSVSAATITANVGQNGQFLLTAPTASTGVSQSQLDSAGLATTATLPLKIVGFPQRPDNVPGDTYFSYWVKLNTSQLSTGTGSAGV